MFREDGLGPFPCVRSRVSTPTGFAPTKEEIPRVVITDPAEALREKVARVARLTLTLDSSSLATIQATKTLPLGNTHGKQKPGGALAAI